MHATAIINRRRHVSACSGPKKFAEPVSLSSTASADLPLAGTALGLGFDLLALRARRKQQSNVSGTWVKGLEKATAAICGHSLFQYSYSLFRNLLERVGREVRTGGDDRSKQLSRNDIGP